MPKITLTDFIEVVTKSGSPKATKVSQLKNREAYAPATDFYKTIREGVVKIHKESLPKSELTKLTKSIHDPKKTANYPAMIDGYKKWWGNKRLTWIDPINAVYSNSGIDVAINPEIGLEINSVPHIIKLYFKNDMLTKIKSDLITTLMSHVLSQKAVPNTNFSILDVRNSKLFTYSATTKNFQPMVDAELSYIASLWPHV